VRGASSTVRPTSTLPHPEEGLGKVATVEVVVVVVVVPGAVPAAWQ
jgi:hypothetical protein